MGSWFEIDEMKFEACCTIVWLTLCISVDKSLPANHNGRRVFKTRTFENLNGTKPKVSFDVSRLPPTKDGRENFGQKFWLHPSHSKAPKGLVKLNGKVVSYQAKLENAKGAYDGIDIPKIYQYKDGSVVKKSTANNKDSRSSSSNDNKSKAFSAYLPTDEKQTIKSNETEGQESGIESSGNFENNGIKPGENSAKSSESNNIEELESESPNYHSDQDTSIVNDLISTNFGKGSSAYHQNSGQKGSFRTKRQVQILQSDQIAQPREFIIDGTLITGEEPKKSVRLWAASLYVVD